MDALNKGSCRRGQMTGKRIYTACEIIGEEEIGTVEGSSRVDGNSMQEHEKESSNF